MDNKVSNEKIEKVNMGCLSVFFTGLKGFVVVSLLVFLFFVALLVLLVSFFWYMNFLVSAPMWLTLLGIAIPIIVFIGLYMKLYEWSVIKAREYKNKE